MTDISGNVVWSAAYTAFGEATVDPTSTITNNLRFAGQYFDEETNKHYNWNRYYDPKTGRYTQVDPIGFGAGDGNLYRYIKNSVINATDPKGLLMEYYKKPFRLYETAPKGFKDLTKEETEEAYKSYLKTKEKLDDYYFEKDYNSLFGKTQLVPGQFVGSLGYSTCMECDWNDLAKCTGKGPENPMVKKDCITCAIYMKKYTKTRDPRIIAIIFLANPA